VKEKFSLRVLGRHNRDMKKSENGNKNG